MRDLPVGAKKAGLAGSSVA